MLLRWRELQEYANATKQVWPLSTTLAAEFDLFAAALTFAFRDSTQAPQFMESKKYCDLPCFAKELGLNHTVG